MWEEEAVKGFLEFSMIFLLKDTHFVLFTHIEMEHPFIAKAESGIFSDI